MRHALAVIVGLIVFYILGTSQGFLPGFLGALLIGGMSWFAFAWSPSRRPSEPRQPQQKPSLSETSTPSKHQSVEDLYAIYFISAISDGLALNTDSPEAKTLRQLAGSSVLDQNKMLLNIAIVQVALCTIVVNFLSDLRTKVNVRLLMDRLAERARNKFSENLKKQGKEVLKGRLAEYVKTEAEKETLKAIYGNGYKDQDLIQMDVLFDSLLHHRVVEYANAFANSNDQPFLGGRAYEISHRFCVNVFGEGFEQTIKNGPLIPGALTAMLNVELDGLLHGLRGIEEHFRPGAT